MGGGDRKQADGREDSATAEDLIAQMYLAGDPLHEIARQAGVSRTTVAHVLRRKGIVPNRTRFLSDTSRDEVIVGLREVIDHQDRRIGELEVQISQRDRKIASLDRALKRATATDNKAATKRVASKPRRAG